MNWQQVVARCILGTAILALLVFFVISCITDPLVMLGIVGSVGATLAFVWAVIAYEPRK